MTAAAAAMFSDSLSRRGDVWDWYCTPVPADAFHMPSFCQTAAAVNVSAVNLMPAPAGCSAAEAGRLSVMAPGRGAAAVAEPVCVTGVFNREMSPAQEIMPPYTATGIPVSGRRSAFAPYAVVVLSCTVRE